MIGYILNPKPITKKIFADGRYAKLKEQKWLDRQSNEERARIVKGTLELQFNRLLNKNQKVYTTELCKYASRPVVGRFLREKLKKGIIVYKRVKNDCWYERV